MEQKIEKVIVFQKRKCGYCRKWFTPKRKKQKYCSEECERKRKEKYQKHKKRYNRPQTDWEHGTIWTLHMTENLDEEWLWTKEVRE